MQITGVLPLHKDKTKRPALALVEDATNGDASSAQLSHAPKGQVHHTRISAPVPNHTITEGLVTMDGGKLRLTWHGYLGVMAAIAVVMLLCTISFMIGNYRGEVQGYERGYEAKEREFILENIKQINNIKTAQSIFGDEQPDKPQQQEKK